MEFFPQDITQRSYVPEAIPRLLDPAVTLEQILTLVRIARSHGSRPVVLTLLPVAADCNPPNVDLQECTRRVSQGLILKYVRRHSILLGDVRDRFGQLGMDDLSTNGLHPNAAGHALIAELLAALIPAPVP